jgi:transposase
MAQLAARFISLFLEFDCRINARHRSNELSKRLDELHGVGPVLATALVASIADSKAFRSPCTLRKARCGWRNWGLWLHGTNRRSLT